MTKLVQDIQGINPMGPLEFLARQVVEGFITGLHKSPYHGFSVEFAEHRIYNKGESTRHIDWKLFGKTDKLFVKRYEEETNLRCQILLDCSASMHYPERKSFDPNRPNKIQFATLAAAALMNLLRKQRDAVGLTTFAESIQAHTPARTTQTHHRLIFEYLEQAMVQPQPGGGTQVAKTLDLIAERIHKRSLVIIFSDMLDTDSDQLELLFKSLQHFKFNKHEVILFHTFDKRTELDFSFENRPYKFQDLETGAVIKLNPEDVREVVQQRLSERAAAVRLKCLQYQIDYVEADVEKGFEQILMPFLLKRQKLF
jgi:uncharacterized protein (DUF58 family)